MPEITKEELWRQLKQAHIAPVYLLSGSETYYRDRFAAEIATHSFVEGDLREFNYDEFTLNNKLGIDGAIAAAEQLPMMSSRRVIRINDIRVAATSAKDTLREDDEQLLARYLANPSPTTVLIMVADELNGNRKMTKLLRANTVTVEFKKLEEKELPAWIRKKAGELGSTFDDPAMRRLIELTGPDLQRLTNEIEKLSAAALPSNVITFDLVDALVSSTSEMENFVLTNALVSGRGSHALSAMKKILDDGAEPIALLGLLSYTFRRLLMAKEMMARGDDRPRIASILGMRYGVQEDFLAAARRADNDRLRSVFNKLKNADLAMKTSVGGGGTPGNRMQLEVLVCEIVAAMGRN
jgi:DNA polymerase-3 subunit delta